MGPKLKRKLTKEKISLEQKQEKKVVLAREKQRKRRARLIGGKNFHVTQKKKRSNSSNSGSETSENLHETPEETPLDVDIKEERISDDENTQKVDSEILPGPKGQLLYYDGVGYYYTQLCDDVTYRWLQCSHGDCKVMAQMKRDDKAPIRLVDPSSRHEHPPNPARRDRILFLHTIKSRHANENTPFSVIFHQEASKNPVGASFFSFDKIQAHLQKKISLGGSDNLSQESVLSAASKLSMIAANSPTIDKEQDSEPAAKKMRIENNTPRSGNRSKKIELLKSLQDVSVTESELSESTATPPSKPSERLPGPYPHSYVYHDGYGHFYRPISITSSTRFLICNTEGCRARAVMAVDENAPISLEADSPAHNHDAQAPTQKVVTSSPAIRSVSVSSRGGQEKENQAVVQAVQNQEDDRMQTPMVVINKFIGVPKKKRFEKLEGPEYYYDYRGHYYFTTNRDNNRRFLRCLYPSCLARAIMTSNEEDVEIKPMAGSRPHNHLPDHTKNYHNKIKEWEQDWPDCLPSERLPSLRVQYCCYHDGRGYYYFQTKQTDNIRFLACQEPKCPVKAYMNTLKDAPITISGLRMGHSHGPDHTLRDALLFIDAVRIRVRSNVPPASAIAFEATRNPVGTERVEFQALRMCLEQANKLTKNQSKEGITENEVDFTICLKTKPIPLQPSTGFLIHIPNHFTIPILEKNQNMALIGKEKCGPNQPELVPALLSDSWLYHDGSGYYYNTKSVSSGYRYLQCVLPKCGVQAVVAEAGGPVKPRKPHNHGPQPPHHHLELWFFHRVKVRAQKYPDLPITQIYKDVADKDPEGAALVSQVDVLQLMQKYLISVIKGSNIPTKIRHTFQVNTPLQAEILPTVDNGCQYHDGQGFYYVVDNVPRKSSTVFLRCNYRAACPARAFLEGGKLKMINGQPRHTHKPDLTHKDLCLFTQALKKRARDDDTPISDIYKEEARKYPKAAAILKEDTIKEKLISIRRFTASEVSMQGDGDDVEDSANCINQSRPFIASELIPGRAKNVYHDGKGYYYHETFATNQLRYLMCCEPHCLAQAKMGLMAGSPVLRQVGAPRHCHAPDLLRRDLLLLIRRLRQKATKCFLTPNNLWNQEVNKDPIIAAQIPKVYFYNVINNARIDMRLKDKKEKVALSSERDTEDDEVWAFSEAGERLPSEHGWLYHNSRGYFYYSYDVDKTKTRRILQCCEEGCDATARLEDDLRVTRAPGSLLHNHHPEPNRVPTLLMLHRVATRAQLENDCVSNIYSEEEQRDPYVAANIPKNVLNETLQSLTIRKYFKEWEEETLCQKEDTSEEFIAGAPVVVEQYEILPSATLDKPVYHNRRGFYYTILRKTNDRQFLKCLMPLCNAQAYLDSSQPLKLQIPKPWEKHNHEPDPLYRNKLLFMSNIRKRALTEGTPVDVIYREERSKEPVGAHRVNEASLKTMMYKLRKSKRINDEVACMLEDTGTYPFENPAEDVSGLITDGVANTASAPTVQTQFSIREVTETVDRHEDQTVVLPMVQVKQETTETTETKAAAEDEGGDEYTEEEYLEEERLEEDEPPAVESSPVVNTYKTWTRADEVHLPSEKLPLRTNNHIYHNGKGYYFQINSLQGKNVYMKCVEPKCKVRGVKSADRDDAPIIPSNDYLVHNHPPDLTRRNDLLFIQRCKDRATNEVNSTISEIWDTEAAGDPESASHYNSQNVKAQMMRHRVQHAVNSVIPLKGTKESSSGSKAVGGTARHDTSVTHPTSPKKEPVDIHQDSVPEKIPSLVGDILWYADGYFYSTCTTSGSIEKVKCVEKLCMARAQVTLGDKGQPPSIKMIKTPAHSHPPDLQRRDQMLFIERCKRRAATTLQSVEEIYYDEAAKAPEVAAQLSAVRVKRAMSIAKKERLKKGARPETKEWDESGASGDHGMSELDEMAKVQAPSPTVADREEAAAPEQCGTKDDSDYCDSDDSANDGDELWTVDPLALSEEEKAIRRKSLARERQRRRRMKLATDPDKREQLEKEKESTRQRASAWQKKKKTMKTSEKSQEAVDSQPKTKPLLGPKFVKALVKNTEEEEEEEFQEEEELLDETYSDYVTLEEELDSYETMHQNEGEEETESVQKESQKEDTYEPEEKTPKIKRSHLVHGRKLNSYCFHDGNGFFYDNHKIVGNNRYLKCVVVGCKAEGCMSLDQDDGPITLAPQSPAHFHPPDPRHRGLNRFVNRCEARALREDKPLQSIYDQEVRRDPVSASKLVMAHLLQRMAKIRKDSLEAGTQLELNSSSGEDQQLSSDNENEDNAMSDNDEDSDQDDEAGSSEILPGYRPDVTIFHDMNGYYYVSNALRCNKRYLECMEPQCKVRGKMKLYDGAPIQPNSDHNHQPDLQRKNFYLFLEKCKDRAIAEDGRLPQIYQEECEKDPVSAAMISRKNILNRMRRARKQSSRYYPTEEDQQELAEVFASNKSTTDIPQQELVVEETLQDQELIPSAGEDQQLSSDNEDEDNAMSDNDGDCGQGDEAGSSEILPGYRPDVTIFHDMKGYYYVQNALRCNKRYLECMEPLCKVRAKMNLYEGAPIQPNSVHNHRPDLQRKNFFLFLEKCKDRAIAEDGRLPQIYREECEKDPVSASMISEKNILNRMRRARKQSSRYYPTDEDQQELAEVFASNKSTSDIPPRELVEEETLLDQEEPDQQHEAETASKALLLEGAPVPMDQAQPPEVLPGDKPNTTLYHDGRGYYFNYNAQTPNNWYLKCTEPQCKVRARMERKEGSPMIQRPNTIHNHRPDFKRRQFVLWMEQAKHRAVTEDLPIPTLYAQEAARDPASASMIAPKNMKKKLYRARKLIDSKVSSEMETAEEGDKEAIEDRDAEEEPDDIYSDEHIDVAAAADVSEAATNAPPLEGAPVPMDEAKPPEVLPGDRRDTTLYHDGRGYYFVYNAQTPNNWYLRCLEPQCRVRARMERKEGSPMIQRPNTIHNHRPDFKRRQFVLWMEQAKHRAVTEDLPIPTLYAQEAARDPESASMIAAENMKTRLYRARKLMVGKSFSESETAEDGGREAIEEKDSEVTETSSEPDRFKEDSEAVFTIQAEDSQDNTVYLYQSNDSSEQTPVYVDEQGFCYQQTSIRSNVRYLKCLEAGCNARASMGLEEGSVITLSQQGSHHNHTVEQSQLAMLVDSDVGPIQVVYTDEDGGQQQVSLCQIADKGGRLKRPYKQRHKPDLTINTEELKVDPSALCDVDISGDAAETNFYHNEDQQYPLKPSEVIPGLRPDANNYHDGNGYYYELNRLSPNIRYLKCLIKDCKARAYMELGKENAPIIQTNFARHNHGPDPSRKQFTVFLHRVTRRAAEEDTPIHVIYEQEAERDPQSARQIRMENVKQRMMRSRKKKRQGKIMKQEGSSASEIDMEGSIYHFFMGGEKTEPTHQEEVGEGWEGEAEEEEGVDENEEEKKIERVEGIYEEIVKEEGEEVLYESYVVSEVEVESQQQQG